MNLFKSRYLAKKFAESKGIIDYVITQSHKEEGYLLYVPFSTLPRANIYHVEWGDNNGKDKED